METNSEYMNTREAAAYLGVSDKTVRNLCTARKIQYRRLSERNIQFKKEWLDEYLESVTVLPENKEENNNE